MDIITFLLQNSAMLWVVFAVILGIVFWRLFHDKSWLTAFVGSVVTLFLIILAQRRKQQPDESVQQTIDSRLQEIAIEQQKLNRLKADRKTTVEQLLNAKRRLKQLELERQRIQNEVEITPDHDRAATFNQEWDRRNPLGQ